MKPRGRWQGVLVIARLNWPFYLAAIVFLCASVVGLFQVGSVWLRFSLGMIALGCLYFVFVSLGVSHWIYDRSDLYRWKWLAKALPGRAVGRIVFCHSGFDESSEMLSGEFPEADYLILDHYDSTWMSEPSIKRARRLYPPVPGTLTVPFDDWPVEEGWADVVFGILAIHELRETEERTDWFREAGRCLGDDGRIVIVEHVRDVANFLAFGPGFLHFHSKVEWEKSWEVAGLCLVEEMRITPFVRVFVLKCNE